jgi:hypothetical protein
MALARESRRIAKEVEQFYISLAEKGELVRIRSFLIAHKDGAPNFDLVQAAKSLRCYAASFRSCESDKASQTRATPPQ